MGIRFYFAIALIVASSAARAEWVSFFTDADKNVYFIDPSSIRKSGARVKYWMLTDYAERQTQLGEQFLSTKIRYEYDCENESRRALHLSTYSKRQGEGRQVTAFDEQTQWLAAPPDTLHGLLMSKLCNKSP